MDDQEEQVNLFQKLIVNYFEKVKKHLPKKYASLKDFVNKMTDQMKNERSCTLGKQLIIFRLTFNMRSQKMNELNLNTLMLDFLQQLVSKNYIDGRQEDISQEYQFDEFPELQEDSKQMKPGTKVLIADSLTYTVSQCLVDKEEITLKCIQLMVALATNARCSIIGPRLMRIVKILVYAYTQSKSVVVDRVARSGLIEIMQVCFQAMEIDNVSLVRSIAPKPKTQILQQQQVQMHDSTQINVTNGNFSSPILKLQTRRIHESVEMLQDQDAPQSMLSLSPHDKIEPNFNNFDFPKFPISINEKAPHAKILDDVVLYLEKTKTPHLEVQIPLRAVPYDFSPSDPAYHQIVIVDILNEIGKKAGKFGWCVNCRETANFYCKDHRVPICSYTCKRQNMEFIEWAQRIFDVTQRQRIEALESASYTFDQLCKMLSGKQTIGGLKNQQMLLELILLIADQGEWLRGAPAIIKTVRDTLCSQLLKFCFDTEKILFVLSFKVFLKLFWHLRKEMKHEIGVFIDQIFLKILESTNSSFQHKQIALEVLMKMMERKKTALEFFVNFDCSMEHVCILERIVDILNRIIDGIYQKQDFISTINGQQEIYLRVTAVHVVCCITHGLAQSFDQVSAKEEAQKALQDEDDSQNLLDEDVERQLSLKAELQKGVELFNRNPEKGVKLLIKAGILTGEGDELAKSITTFLRQNQSVTKDAIGTFFGGEHSLNQKVLSSYTDLLNMRNMTVEIGLRYYLDHFTLPSESQQVDRVVQKFSDKYFRDNSKGLFKSSDAIYTFSYLLVMLQTDLHNPRVEEKMKFQDFQKLARSINDGEDLPIDYLQTIYNNIQKTPLAVHEKEKQKILQESSKINSFRKKEDQFVKERQQLIKKVNEMIRIRSPNKQQYTKVNSLQYMKPLLDTLGQKIFLSLCISFTWDLTGPQNTILPASEIILALTEITKLFSYYSINFDVDRLVKLTGLWGTQYLEKHLSLAQSLLALLPYIGNGLKLLGFRPFLELISRIDEIRGSKELLRQGFESENLFNVDYEMMDKIYVKTKLLDNQAILEFIEALCQVSKAELFSQNTRTFSLQKLVEVSDYNMDRIRFIWAKMWALVRDHFSEVGTKANTRVAISAVDMLKQLSVKFLQKEELYSLQFQREFLKPFETVFINTENEEIKEYILQCMNHIVLNYKHNIKSGWRVIFDLINYALQEDSDKISRTAYQILCRIMSHNLDLIQDVFVDLIQSLARLGKKQQEDLALASVEFVKQCLNYLSESAGIKPESLNQNQVLTQELLTMSQLENNWVPLLGQLSTLAGDSRAKVQETAMDTLFMLLHNYGYAFSNDFWKIVFQVVLRPLFDEIQFTFQMRTNHKSPIGQESPSTLKENHWFKLSCQKGFNFITNLVNEFFPKLRELLPDFLKLFENCIQNQNEVKFIHLAKYSLSAVKNTVLKLGQKFNDTEWEEIIQFYERMFKVTTPSKLLSVSIQELTETRRNPKFKLKLSTEEAYTQCVSQLLLIQVTKDLIENYGSHLSLSNLMKLDSCLSNSYAFAHEFNASVDLRFHLWRSGFMAEMKQLPGLLRQERESQACMFTLKYKIYKKLAQQSIQEAKKKLQEYKSQLIETIQLFIQKHKEFYSMERSSSQEKFQYQKPLVLKPNASVIVRTEEDDYPEIKHLKIQEIERDATNLRTLLDQSILPEILALDDEELMESSTEFFDSILSASQYALERNFIQSTCLDCKDCERCYQVHKDTLGLKFRQALKKIFDLQKK